MKKQIALLTAAAIICLSVAGCAAKPAPVANESSSSSSTAANDNFNPTGYPIVKEKVTIKIMAAAGGDMMNLDYDSMGMYKKVEALTNIHIDWNVMKDGEEFKQKKTLMYTSGQYPDVILKGTTVEDEENFGVSQKIIIPLTQYINEEYMPNLTKAFEKSPDLKKLVTASDGNIYGLPSSRDSGYTNTGHLFINKKFLKNLNMEVPKTLEEFEKYLDAVKTQDADGDGDPTNEIPYTSVYNNDNSGFIFLYGLFGVVGSGSNMSVDDGKVSFTPNTPEYRNALTWINKAYTNGWMDKEVISQDGATAAAKIKTGKVGVFNEWRLNQLNFSYPGISDDYMVIPPPKVDGVDPKIQRSALSASTGRVVITNANKHVEETVRWLDYFYDPVNSIENSMGEIGKMVQLNADGKYETMLKPDGTPYGNQDMQTWSPGTSGIYIIGSDTQKNKVVQPDYLFEKYAYCKVYEPYLCETSPALINRGRLQPEDSRERDLLRTDIDKYVGENAIRFVTKGITDADWQSYVQRFDSMKLDAYVALCQKSYDNYVNVKQ